MASVLCMKKISRLISPSPWKNNLDSSSNFSRSGEGSALPPCNTSRAFSKSVGSATSTFPSAEYLMDFPQFEPQVRSPSLFEPPTFESEVKLPLHEYGTSAACDKRQKLFYRHHQDVLAQSVAQSTEEGLDSNLNKRQLASLGTADRSSVKYNLENFLVRNPNFQIQNVEKHSEASIVVPVTSFNPNLRSPLPSKTRIRWTPNLHEKFIECVNCLGGAEKATPKGILKLMDLDGLTIYHIKSHLQKYRLAKYLPESSEGKFQRKANELQQFDPKTVIPITEALQIQLQVQRHLHEQLEIQRNLQMRIEAQGRQLQKLFKEQMKSNKILFETQGLDDLFPDKIHEKTPENDQVFGVGEDHQNNHFSSKIS
ncbi:protein PHOSPHATE STARVATION RESPONSE 1-like [Phalaenopsis equestris]|uniref:protein PHOSPHATE STARVATION RESPONSE 1-like n=1 Tax=Phalaenopsis equestris TaxID=78828 RepID=UPI0009E51E91|nr:protein PHOSPHATE STARVATION RESPONSE 1-like [Phalaenopsis equestris]